MTTTTPTYTVGQRVVVNGVEGHFVKAWREGGPGVIRRVYKHGATVILDSTRESSIAGGFFMWAEIKPEPTI
jgi:hypothetical protein